MYDNNDNYNNYSQPQNNPSNSTVPNNGYREYYYTTNSSYSQTPQNNTPKKNKRTGGFGKKAVSAACFGLIFGVTAGAVFSVPAYMSVKELNKAKASLEAVQSANNQTNSETSGNQGAAPLSTTTNALSAANAAYTSGSNANVAAIAQSCLPSVVSITNKGVTEVQTFFGRYLQDTEGSGSGIIIGENDKELLIVTNYHVVSGNTELSVVFSYDEDSEDPSVVSAKVKGYDSDKDLAVIAISLDDITDEMRSQIKVATIGDSSNLELGQEVVAIGNALGYGQSVTTGIISALNREVTVSDDNGGTITNRLIQTDAAINPGNSGGALLNMDGELVGINSVKVSSSSVEGMGYAIPISDVQSIIEELMLKESRDVVSESAQGYLGITPLDVTTEVSEAYGLPLGIYISKVYDDSPAEAAGLSKGDIITKFDGQTVKTKNDLITLLTYYRAGETVDVIAMVQSANGYTEKTFTVTLGAKDIFGDSTDDTPQENYNNNEIPDSDFFYDPFEFFWSIP
ncbi:MAG: trypsin-like peptidase domain-containing protein [Lachnospiraceae bacterium]|nr:trypsin-like peptidase domain-containing protein [Lachnospiraceae bacterium]